MCRGYCRQCHDSGNMQRDAPVQVQPAKAPPPMPTPVQGQMSPPPQAAPPRPIVPIQQHPQAPGGPVLSPYGSSPPQPQQQISFASHPPVQPIMAPPLQPQYHPPAPVYQQPPASPAVYGSGPPPPTYSSQQLAYRAAAPVAQPVYHSPAQQNRAPQMVMSGPIVQPQQYGSAHPQPQSHQPLPTANVTCPTCKRPLYLPPGQTAARCPSCQAAFTMPGTPQQQHRPIIIVSNTPDGYAGSTTHNGYTNAGYGSAHGSAVTGGMPGASMGSGGGFSGGGGFGF